jgi:hypothetical protein
MDNVLLAQVGGRLRAYPVNPVRVATHLGEGQLVYATDDNWFGVRLDGERRVDEYLPEQLSVVAA